MNRTVSRHPILYRSNARGALSWMAYRASSRIRNTLRPRVAPVDLPRAAEARPVAASRPRPQEAMEMAWPAGALAAG